MKIQQRNEIELMKQYSEEEVREIYEDMIKKCDKEKFVNTDKMKECLEKQLLRPRNLDVGITVGTRCLQEVSLNQAERMLEAISSELVDLKDLLVVDDNITADEACEYWLQCIKLIRTQSELVARLKTAIYIKKATTYVYDNVSILAYEEMKTVDYFYANEREYYINMQKEFNDYAKWHDRIMQNHEENKQSAELYNQLVLKASKEYVEGRKQVMRERQKNYERLLREIKMDLQSLTYGLDIHPVYYLSQILLCVQGTEKVLYEKA